MTTEQRIELKELKNKRKGLLERFKEIKTSLLDIRKERKEISENIKVLKGKMKEKQ